MTPSSNWIPLIFLLFLSVGTAVFVIFTGAHQEALERKLAEQEARLRREAWGRGERRVGLTPGPAGPQIDGFRIESNAVIFEPPLKGRLSATRAGHALPSRDPVRAVTDRRLLETLAEEVLRAHRERGAFAHDVRRIELVCGHPTPYLEKVIGELDHYRVMLSEDEWGGVAVRSIGHEVSHLSNPFLYSWYFEGLCEIRAHNLLASSGLDPDGDIEYWFNRAAGGYARAFSMMRQLEVVVGRRQLGLMLQFLYEKDWKLDPDLDSEVYGTPSGVDIDAWLSNVPERERARCREIILREGVWLQQQSASANDETTIRLPRR